MPLSGVNGVEFALTNQGVLFEKNLEAPQLLFNMPKISKMAHKKEQTKA